MKKVYTFNKGLFRKIGQMMAFALVLALTSATGFAQVAMTWTGDENNRFTNEKNWNPEGSVSGNLLTIPIIDTTATTNVYPLVSGDVDITVNMLEIAYNADINLIRTVTVEMADNTKTITVLWGGTKHDAIDYGSCGIVLNKGRMIMDGYFRMDEMNSIVVINDGYFQVSRGGRTMQMGGPNNTVTKGGQFQINGGTLRIGGGGMGRNFWAREGGQFVIKNNGKLEIQGNWGADVDRIASGYINGGGEFSIVRSYDAVTNLTTYSAVPKDAFIISNSDRQVIVANTPGKTLSMVKTDRVANAKSLVWKYRKQGETTYTAFANSNDTISFTPIFANSGVYYVICEGVDANNATVVTDEVEFFVGSDAITLSPLFNLQYVRVGESGTKIKASYTGNVTAMEWKFAATPSGPYTSFSPAATTSELVPVFDTVGNHYVVLEATIDGVSHRSFELYYIVEEATTLGKEVTWTGLVSNDGYDPANWNPVANPFKNNINVNALADSTKQYPTFVKATGKDSIQNLTVRANAHMTIDIQDTFEIRGGNVYIEGTLDVINGIISHRTSFFRIPVATGKMTLKNNSELWINNLLLGNSNTPNDGGSLHITDNSKVYNYFSTPARISPDSAESVVYLSGNGTYWIINDVRSTVAGWIENGKVVAAQEGYKPYALYDAVSNYTFVKAINANGFMLSTDETQFTTVGSELEAPVGLVNVDGITSWEWKYSTSVLGPWESFSPAAKDVATFNPKFDKAGVYYLVAVDQNGNATGNMMEINVVSIDLLPAEPQTIERTANGTPISYVIPEGITLVKGTWWYTDVATGDVVDTQVADSTFTPKFDVIGVYDIFFYVEVNDVFGKQYFLKSNSVRITVTPRTGVENLAAGTLKLYPNPTTGLFHIDGGVKAYEVQVVDLAGQVITTERFTSGGRQPMMLNRKGVFIVKVSNEDEVKVGRLVVR